MMEPLVIDPPGFDQKAAWQECSDYVEQCGGLAHEDGSPNWRAAFGADPGVCSCPNCHEYYWCWGRKQRCRKCGFEYPTNWWPMYSYGAQHARRTPEQREKYNHYGAVTRARHEAHKYYRWAFENNAEPSMEAADTHPWPTIFPEDATHMAHTPPANAAGGTDGE